MKGKLIFIISLVLGIIILSNSVYAANSSDVNDVSYVPVSSDQSTSSDTINLTNVNYSDYFDGEGMLKDEFVDAGDTLILSGNFYNRNMTINLPINMTGEAATLYNSTIKILENGSGTTISNINIENDDQQGIIIFESENNTIQSNNITVNEDQESYAIYLYDSRNNKILNNNLMNTGNYVTIGILLYASDNNEINANNVNTTGTDVPLPALSSVYLNQDIGDVNEIFTTYGILLLYSSNNSIVDNDVVLTSPFETPMGPNSNCMNSMVGIDIYYDCNDNTVTGNNITVTGNNPYSYGLGVLGATWGTESTMAENNVFSNNIINVMGSYFATGFIAGLNSANTILNGNTINVSADTYSYGVTLEASNNSTITNNTINTIADVNYAVELFTSDDNQIQENGIYVNGNFSLGIGTYNSKNNGIILNTIITIGDNSAPQISEVDSIPAGNEGIKLYQNSNQNTIENNTISSTAEYAVNTSRSSNNTIINNYLISEEGNKVGDDAVTQGTDDTVYGNYGGSPIADFTVNPTSGTAPLTVEFTNKSIGNINGYAWDFENNGIVDSNDPKPTFTYDNPGTYIADLTVTGSGGSDTTTQIITVNYPAPIADFIITPTTGTAPLTVNFTDTSTGNITSYTWDFNNDGIIDCPLQNTTNTYNTPGTYTTKLTVTGPGGSDTKTMDITVQPDTTAPTIIKVDPANGTTSLAGDETFSIIFSEDIMEGISWIELINSAGEAIPFNMSISGNVLTVDPISDLVESNYKLMIHSGSVTDLAGNLLAGKSFRFSVGTAPTIINTSPSNGTTNVSVAKTITIIFSETIRKSSNFWVELVNSTGKFISYSSYITGGNMLVINPDSDLAEASYKLMVHSGSVTDMAGNPLTGQSFRFTAGTSPTVTSTTPVDGSTNISPAKTLTVTFSENIRKSSSFWVELVDSTDMAVYYISYITGGNILVINPIDDLTPNSTYKLKIHTGCLTDTAGNPVKGQSISFTTRDT